MIGVTTIRSLAGLVSAAIAAGVTGVALAQEKTITVVGSNTTVSISGGYYTSVPQAVGFWAEEGLEVVHADMGGSEPAIQALLAGHGDLAIVGSSTTFTLVEKGQPLKGIFATVTNQYIWPAVLPDSELKALADLDGRTIGVASLGSATVPNGRAFVALGGGDPHSVEFLAVGAGADAMIALQRGDVDALMLWDGPYAEIEQRGQPLRYLDDSDVAKAAGYMSEMLVNSETLEEKADLYVAFARGVAKSIVFMNENPECAVRAHWAVYPESRPSGVPEEEALKQGVLIWNSRSVNVKKNDGKWGFNTDEQIAANIKMLELSGTISPGLTPERVADFSLLDQVNDFDEEEVKELARACDFDWAK